MRRVTAILSKTAPCFSGKITKPFLILFTYDYSSALYTALFSFFCTLLLVRILREFSVRFTFALILPILFFITCPINISVCLCPINITEFHFSFLTPIPDIPDLILSPIPLRLVNIICTLKQISAFHFPGEYT